MTIKEFKTQYALGTLSDTAKKNLAYNPNTSKGILTILSIDENWLVRHRVSYNLNTPLDVLKILSTDEFWLIRSIIASNPNTPKEILEILSKDEDIEVKHYAIVKLYQRKSNDQIKDV